MFYDFIFGMQGTTYEEYEANKYTAAFIYFENDENYTSEFPEKTPSVTLSNLKI